MCKQRHSNSKTGPNMCFVIFLMSLTLHRCCHPTLNIFFVVLSRFYLLHLISPAQCCVCMLSAKNLHMELLAIPCAYSVNTSATAIYCTLIFVHGPHRGISIAKWATHGTIMVQKIVKKQQELSIVVFGLLVLLHERLYWYSFVNK